MSKIKIIMVLVVVYISYKLIAAVMDFDIAVQNKVKNIEEIADIEREGEVVGLMMYLGNPLELQEHFLVSSANRCLELKEVAEESSNAYYECAKVNAIVKNKKIIKIIKEIEIIE